MVLALALGLGSAPAAAETVTISFQRYFDPACGRWKMRFFGQVSSGAPLEYVGLLQRTCGAAGPMAAAGTQTTTGGAWEIDTYFGGATATYRASWNNELSKPVTYRPPLAPQVKWLAPGKYRVSVLSWAPTDKPQNMTGDPVDLQRLTAQGRWAILRRAKLAPLRGAREPNTYAATFTVPQGLMLRAFVPTKSAKPCFTAGSSKQFCS